MEQGVLIDFRKRHTATGQAHLASAGKRTRTVTVQGQPVQQAVVAIRTRINHRRHGRKTARNTGKSAI